MAARMGIRCQKVLFKRRYCGVIFLLLEEKAATERKHEGVYPPGGKTGPESIGRQQYKGLPGTNPDDTPQAGTDDYLLDVVYPNGTKLRIKNDLDHLIKNMTF